MHNYQKVILMRRSGNELEPLEEFSGFNHAEAAAAARAYFRKIYNVPILKKHKEFIIKNVYEGK